MKKLRTRALSWVLTLAMLFSMLPISARAADDVLKSIELSVDTSGNAVVKLNTAKNFENMVSVVVLPAFGFSQYKNILYGWSSGAITKESFASGTMSALASYVDSGLPSMLDAKTLTQESGPIKSTVGNFSYAAIKEIVGSKKIYDNNGELSDQSKYPFVAYVMIGGKDQFFTSKILYISDPALSDAELTPSPNSISVVTTAGTDAGDNVIGIVNPDDQTQTIMFTNKNGAVDAYIAKVEMGADFSNLGISATGFQWIGDDEDSATPTIIAAGKSKNLTISIPAELAGPIDSSIFVYYYPNYTGAPTVMKCIEIPVKISIDGLPRMNLSPNPATASIAKGNQATITVTLSVADTSAMFAGGTLAVTDLSGPSGNGNSATVKTTIGGLESTNEDDFVEIGPGKDKNSTELVFIIPGEQLSEVGTYTLTYNVMDLGSSLFAYGTAIITVTEGEPANYSFAVNPATYTPAGTVYYGYNASAYAKDVTITNTGDALSGLAVTATSGGSDFILNTAGMHSILDSGASVPTSTTFTVTPGDGLAVGTHTGVFTVSTSSTSETKTFTYTFTVAKQVAAAAPGLTGTNPTSVGGNNGSIQITPNYDSAKAYEYSADSGNTWHDWTTNSDTQSGLGAGTYSVREKYNSDNQNESLSATVILSDPTKFSATLTIKKDGQPVQTTNVTVNGITVKTDTDGKVEFSDLSTGPHTVTVAGMNNTGSFTVGTEPYTGTLDWYTLTVAAGDHGTTPTGSGVYFSGSTVTVGATADTGWHFNSTEPWKVNSGSASVSSSTVTVKGTATVTAQYEANVPALIGGTLTEVSYGATGYASAAFAEATNGDGTYTYAVSDLPEWLTFNSTARTFSLTPGKNIGDAETYTIKVTATCNGKTSNEAAFTLNVAPATITVAGAPERFNVETGKSMSLADIPTTASTTATSVAANGTTITNTFNGTASGNGALVGTWSVGSGTYAANSNNMTLKFTPTDTNNYSVGTLAVPYKGVTPSRSVAVTYTKDGGSAQDINSYTEDKDYGYSTTSTYVVTFTNDGNLPLYNFKVGYSDSASPIKVTGNTAGSGVTLNVGDSVTVTLKAATGANATEYGGGTPYKLVLTPTATSYAAPDTAVFTAQLKVKPIALTVPTVGSIVHATTVGGHEGSAEVSNTDAYTGIDNGVTYSVASGGSIDANGVIAGLSKGNYTVTVTPKDNHNYVAATSASFTINDGTKYTGKVKIVTEDGAPISGVEFKAVGKDTVVLATEASGEYTAELDNGIATSYEVWANGVNTGKTVASSSRDAGTVNFYKVKIGTVTLPGGGSSPTLPTIEAGSYSNGDLVLENTTVTFSHNFIADGTYDYVVDAWSGSASGSNATATVTYNGTKADVDLSFKRAVYQISGIADNGISGISISGTTKDGATFSKSGTAGGSDNADSSYFEGIPAGIYTIVATLSGTAGWASDSPDKDKKENVEVTSVSTKTGLFNFQTVLRETKLAFTVSTVNAIKAFYTDAPSAVVTVRNDGNVELTGVRLADYTNNNLFQTLESSDAGILNASGITLGVGASATITVTQKAGTLIAGSIATTLTFAATETLDVGSPTTQGITLTITPIALTGVNVTSDGTLASPKAGDTLTATATPNLSANGLTSSDVTYKWFRDGSEISDETGSTYVVKSADEGKAISVTVTGKNNASGTVNATTSAVWYTGAVTVQVDGVNDTTGAYTVVAVEGSLETTLTYDSASGTYKSAVGALDPSKEYTIKASTSEKDSTTALTTTTLKLNAANGMKNTVTYYAVNFNDKATVVHKGTPEAIGEVGVTASTVGVTALATGDTVLANTTVTFTVGDWTPHDYALSWANTDDNSSTANTNTVNYNTAKIATVAATLTQKTYTVTGTVTQMSGGGSLTGITMTDGSGYAYTTGSSAGCTLSGNSVTMTVVKGNYTIAATPNSGTAIIKWNVNNGSDVTPPAKPSVNVTGDGNSFTVTVDGESHKLELSGGGSAVDSDSATKTVTKMLTDVTYGYDAQSPLTITVKNIGNMPLYNVKLGITPSANASFANNADTALMGGTADLGVNDTATFTVTPNTGMNAGTHTYTLTLDANKTKDNNATKIDTLTYVVSLTVKSLALDGTVTVTNETSHSPVNKVGDALKAVYTPASSAITNADYVIKWYDTSGTALGTGETYTLKDGDLGKTLYAKAEPAVNAGGTYNASGSVQSADLSSVKYADYDGYVDVKVGANSVTGANAGGYKVEFWLGSTKKADGSFDATSGKFKSNAKLDGAETGYTVYVNAVEGNTTMVTSGVTVTPATSSASVTYYTVTLESVSVTTVNKTGAALSTGNVTLSAKAGTVDVTSGKAVLSGQSVTVTAGGYAPSTDDYNAAWTNATANTPNNTATASVSGNLAVSLALTQKGHEVIGYVGAGVISVTVTGQGVIPGTSEHYSVTKSNSGGSAGTVAFSNLPNDVYTVTVILEDAVLDKTNPYNEDFTVSSGNLSANAFYIKTNAATYTLKLERDGTAVTNTTAGSPDSWGSQGFGYSAQTKTVTITNMGNTTIWVQVADNNTTDGFGLSSSEPVVSGRVELKNHGDFVTFTVTFAVGQNASATPYTGGFTVSSYKTESDTTAKVTATYTASLMVNAIALTGVTLSSTTGIKAGDTLTATVTPNLSANGLTSSDVTYAWTAGGVSVGTNSATYEIQSDDEGKAITVTVTGKNNASGTVNASTSAVWYTGAVMVGTPNASARYKVYAVNSGDEIELTYDNASGTYKSAVGALDPSKEYTIKASTSEKDSTTALTTTTLKLNAANGMKNTVTYYAVNFNNKAAIVNKGTGTLVADAINVTASTAGVTALATGDTVLANTTVTFTVGDWTTHDYALTWSTNATDGTANDQVATATYSTAIADAIVATLTQKTYTVTGTVTQMSGGGSLTSITMTDGSGYTYTTGSSADCTLSGNSVTMTVVKGNYTIAATPNSGTAIIKWNVNSDPDVIPPVEPSVNVTGNGNSFTVTVDGESHKLELSGGGSAVNSDSAPKTVTEVLTDVTYGYGAQSPLTITVKNIGNMPLYNVKLGITPSANASFANNADTALTGGTADLGVNGTATFTVTPNTGMNAGTYTYTLTLDANKTKDNNATKIDTLTYVVSLTVGKAAITGANIGGVTEPVTGASSTRTLTNVPAGVQSAALSWNGLTDGQNFAPGTVYTATVTLTPDNNHAFADNPSMASYQFNGTNATSVDKKGNTVTMTYLFAKPTTPTLSASLTATDFDKATAGFIVGAQSGAVLEIKYLAQPATEDKPINSALTGTASASTASITGLDPNVEYKLYAIVTVEVGGVKSDSAEMVWSATETTWYKVVTGYTGHGDVAPAITPSTSTETGVKGGTSLSINAVKTKDYWEFSSWSASAGSITNPGTASNSFIAPALTGTGNGTITLTAQFVAAPFSADSNYATTGTYGVDYGTVSNKPTVTTGGSGIYTYALAEGITLPAGLKLNTDGSITGKPEVVGSFAVKVTVTDSQTGATAPTGEVTLIISPATPDLTVKYAAGTYYAENLLDKDLLVSGGSQAKANVLSTGWSTGKVEIDGTWSFMPATGTQYKTGTQSYQVQFTPDSKYGGVYSTATGTVSIYAIKKEFKLDAIVVTPSPNPLKGTYGEYAAIAGGGLPYSTVSVTNSGNQTAKLTYELSGNTDKFELTSATATVEAGITNSSVQVKVKSANLDAGTYTTTLTVTNTSAPADALNRVQTAAITFVVEPKNIKSATLTGVDNPAVGENPATQAAVVKDGGAGHYSVTSIAWEDLAGNVLTGTFAPGTTYKVTVELKADPNYRFVIDGTSEFKLGKNDTSLNAVSSAAYTGSNTEKAQNSVKLVYTFPSTTAGTVTVAAEGVDEKSGKITAMSAESAEALTFHYMVLAKTDARPSPAEVRSGSLPSGVVEHYGMGTRTSTGFNDGKATWSGTISTLATMSPGTEYMVYLVAVPASGVPSAVASAKLTTYYEVKMVSSDTTKGTVSPTGPLYVKPGTATDLFSGTAKSGYQFKGWSIDASGGGSFSSTGNNTSGKATGESFVPTKNTTITGAFDGKVILATSGTAAGDEVNVGYAGTNINLYINGNGVSNSGIIRNDGAGAMTGNLKAKIVAQGGAFDSSELTGDDLWLTVSINSGTDTKLTTHGGGGDSTTVQIHPVDGKSIGEYKARVWFYEERADSGITEPVSVDVKFNVIPAGQVAYYPKDHSWNLYNKATTNTEWAIDVTNAITSVNGYDTVDEIKMTSGTETVVDPANYTYVPGSMADPTNPTPGKLTFSEDFLKSLAGGKQVGDKVTFSVVLKNSGTKAKTGATVLTLTYTDSTPELRSVSITPDTSKIGKGTKLTASVSTSDGSDPTASQVTYTWFKTKGNTTDGTMVQNPASNNSNEYTVQDTDEGYWFYVVVKGVAGEYNGTKTGVLSQTAQFTVELQADQGGTAFPTGKQFVTSGEHAVAVATANAGYIFTKWMIASGNGNFATVSGPNESSIASDYFYPTTSSVLSAKFDQLPTLVSDKSTYTVGTDPVGVKLTYTRHDGTYSKITLTAPGGSSRDMTSADFTGAPTLGTDGDYTLSKTMLDGLAIGGSYTVTFVDSHADPHYTKSVTINVVRPSKGLTSIVIDETSVTLGDTLHTTLTPVVDAGDVRYQWYMSGDGLSAGVPIVGATGATYATPAHGNVTVGLNTEENLSGKYLYVVATGLNDYAGSVVTSEQRPVASLKYNFTVKVVKEGSATGVTSIDSGATFDASDKTVTNVTRGDGRSLIARADNGFVFVGWTITSGTGRFGSMTGETTSASESVLFYPTSADAVVVATFREKAPISSVTLTMTAPVKGVPPTNTATPGNAGYSVESVSWSPVNNPFAADTIYTAVIVLEPAAGESFVSKPTVLVNSGTATVKTVDKDTGTGKLTITVEFPKTGSTMPPVNPGGPGGGTTEAFTVTYDLRDGGTTKDNTVEAVTSGQKPSNVPTVTNKNGYTFKGWSQSDPSKTKEPKLVDPKTVTIKENTIFYAVYDGPVTGEHEHYIKGYDTGIFAPEDAITRGQVAAIIARACLDGFRENTDYGNGGYTDVADDHWARSAIAFVTKAGVFVGDGEGHFEADRPITRQEFALVFSRMVGLLNAGEVPFSDAGTTADWAVAGVYTAYTKGWVIGYTDGTFKPWNNIIRSEAVKIVNRYLNRGVNAEGIKGVYSELKQWPDVASTHWAYYEILEASNDHTYFYVDGKQPPEVYTKAYIEEASWGK